MTVEGVDSEEESGVVSGQYLYDADDDGALSDGDVAVEGAQVWLQQVADGDDPDDLNATWETVRDDAGNAVGTQTDAEGRYSLGIDEVGSYRLRFEDPDTVNQNADVPFAGTPEIEFLGMIIGGPTDVAFADYTPGGASDVEGTDEDDLATLGLSELFTISQDDLDAELNALAEDEEDDDDFFPPIAG